LFIVTDAAQFLTLFVYGVGFWSRNFAQDASDRIKGAFCIFGREVCVCPGVANFDEFINVSSMMFAKDSAEDFFPQSIDEFQLK
jgi:hypothetical protein